MLWHFFSCTITDFSIFVFYLLLYAWDVNPKLQIVNVIFILVLILSSFFSSFRKKYIKIFTSIATFITVFASIAFISFGEIINLRFFLLTFFVYSIFLGIIKEFEYSDTKIYNFFFNIMTQIFKGLGLLTVTTFLFDLLDKGWFIQFEIGTTNYILGYGTFYVMVNLIAYIVSLFGLFVLLLFRNKQLATIGVQLEKISSWSIDRSLLNKDLKNSDRILRNNLRIVVFGDIRGFTKFSQKNSIKSVARVLEKFYSIVEDQVVRYSGFKPEFIADEFITFFENSENAIEFAIHTSKAVGFYLKQYNLGIGIGIDKGMVLEGIFGGKNSRKYTILGKAANIAARLQAAAKAGEIYATQRVTNGFRNYKLRPIQGLKLKGVASSLIIYQILGKKERVVEKKSFLGKFLNGVKRRSKFRIA